MTKSCPYCNNDCERGELMVCNTSFSCEDIICKDCQIDHLASYHKESRELEDEEWEEFE